MARWSYPEALEALWQRSAYERGVVVDPFGYTAAPDLGLVRTRRLLEAWGGLPLPFKTIHVAGSKGKGSSCAFAASVLVAGGIRTGLYTSPHIHTIRERISTDGQPISEEDFADLAQRAIGRATLVERADPALGELTAFEITTAMALKHFGESGCAMAVVEVGLGGALDATNVVDGDVSVITLLDYEHTGVLGATLGVIAASKAGIIKAGRPVVSASQAPEALRVIEDTAAQCRAPLRLADRDWTFSGGWRSFRLSGPWGDLVDLRAGLIGDHQVANAANAIAALWALGAGSFPVAASAVRDGIAAVGWPGRYEVINRGSIRVVLDGAHSPASARALARTIKQEERGRDVVVVLGMLDDKDAVAFALELRLVAARFVATATSHPRSVAPGMLSEALRKAAVLSATAPSVSMALGSAAAAAGQGGTVIVTGSLTMVAEAREGLGVGRSDPGIAG